MITCLLPPLSRFTDPFKVYFVLHLDQVQINSLKLPENYRSGHSIINYHYNPVFGHINLTMSTKAGACNLCANRTGGVQRKSPIENTWDSLHTMHFYGECAMPETLLDRARSLSTQLLPWACALRARFSNTSELSKISILFTLPPRLIHSLPPIHPLLPLTHPSPPHQHFNQPTNHAEDAKSSL